MRLNSCDSEKNNTVLSTNQRLTNKIHSYTPKKKNLLHSIKKNNLTLNDKFDYSCKKKEFMDVFSSDKETTDINTTLKENSLFNRSCKIDEKSQCVSPEHKNSAEDFFSDNLVLTNANKLFIKAVENVKPSVETRNVKVSGMTYPVPAVIGKHRQQILAIRWLIECATKNKKNTSISFCECLASELYEALISSGKAKQKRDAMHKHAEYNRAYIRFKWW